MSSNELVQLKAVLESVWDSSVGRWAPEDVIRAMQWMTYGEEVSRNTCTLTYIHTHAYPYRK